MEKQVQKTTKDTHRDLGSGFQNRNLATGLFTYFTSFEYLVIHSCDVRAGCSCLVDAVGQKRPVSADRVTEAQTPLRKKAAPSPVLHLWEGVREEAAFPLSGGLSEGSG